MSLQKSAPIGVLILALLIGAGALVSQARVAREARVQAAPGPNSLACVDMNRIYMASTAPREYDLKSVEIETEMERQLQGILAVPMLIPQELQEFGGLIVKPMPADAEKARMKALKEVSDKRAEELRTLQSKKDLTPQERMRLQELTDLSRFLNQRIPTILDAMKLTQRAQLDAFRNEQIAQLRVVVGQVAREKGFEQVFDAGSLVYSTNDLTEAVLQKVKKRNK